MQALALFLVLCIGAAALIVAGAYLTFGSGPAMFAAGACVFGAALFVRRGMIVNG